MKWPNPRNYSSMSGKNDENIQKKKCHSSWHAGGQALNEELPKYAAGLFTT